MAEGDKETPATPGSGGGTNALAAGQRVGAGRFTLQGQLGQGGMGTVWLAKDEELGEELALKFLTREISHDAETLQDLRRETLKSRKLTHPNIIRIHDLHQAPGEAPFISMEYVDGQTLSRLKTEQPQRCFGWDYLKPLVKQLCDALDYAHGEHVIHRDLKPTNLMLDARGRLKLADFGLAAVVSDSLSRLSHQRSSSGTLAYMSPQQMDGRTPHVTDDIYALGATLYELLTSKPPFYQGNVPHQVKNLSPAPLDQRLTDLGLSNAIPPDVAALIMVCLAKEPAQRPQSAGAVAEWIGLTLGTRPTGQLLARAVTIQPEPENEANMELVVEAAEPEEEAVKEESHPGVTWNRRRWWVGLSLSALMLAVLLGWLVMQKSAMPGTTGSTVSKPERLNRLPSDSTAAGPALASDVGKPASGGASLLKQGLIAHWPLDGNANDQSGNAHNGMAVGTTPASDRFGHPNHAYSFDGRSSFIAVPSHPAFDLIQRGTVSLWFYKPNKGVRALMDKKTAQIGGTDADGWRIDTGYPQNLSFRYAGGAPVKSVESTVIYSAQQWHHLVVALTGGEVALYLDGEAAGGGAYGKNPGNGLDLYIGRAHRAPGVPHDFFFEGALDDIRVYDRALTAEEVRELYLLESSKPAQ